MKNFQQDLTNFRRGDWYAISRKIVLNQIIENKDFSGLSFRHVKFFNCSFKSISFAASRSYSLTFCNCQFCNVSFAKTELINITFLNCQLMNCSYGSSEAYCVRYLNCQLNKVNFNAADLMNFEFVTRF